MRSYSRKYRWAYTCCLVARWMKDTDVDREGGGGFEFGEDKTVNFALRGMLAEPRQHVMVVIEVRSRAVRRLTLRLRRKTSRSDH